MHRLYALKAGDIIPDAILQIAQREKIASAAVTAIGGVNNLDLSYFNHETKKYEEHEFHEFMEVTGLIGNITQKDGKPFLHAHGTFGKKDLTVVGGHLMSATVFPLLEVSVLESENVVARRFDDDTGLNVMAI